MVTTVHTTFSIKCIYTKYFQDFLARYLSAETVLSKDLGSEWGDFVMIIAVKCRGCLLGDFLGQWQSWLTDRQIYIDANLENPQYIRI